MKAKEGLDEAMKAMKKLPNGIRCLIRRERSLSLHPSGASDKDSACQCRRYKRCRFDPWVGGGHGNPLENPVDRGAWWAMIHGVSELDRMKQFCSSRAAV